MIRASTGEDELLHSGIGEPDCSESSETQYQDHLPPVTVSAVREKAKELYNDYIETVQDQLGDVEVKIRKQLGLYSVADYVTHPIAAPIFASNAMKFVEYSKGELNFPVLKLLESAKAENTFELINLEISDQDFLRCVFFVLLYVFDTPIVTEAFQFSARPVDLDLESFFVMLAAWNFTLSLTNHQLSQETFEQLTCGIFSEDDYEPTSNAVREVYSVLQNNLKIEVSNEYDPTSIVSDCAESVFKQYEAESKDGFEGNRIFRGSSLSIETILNWYIQISMKQLFKTSAEGVHFVEQLIKRFNVADLTLYANAHIRDVPELYPEGFVLEDE